MAHPSYPGYPPPQPYQRPVSGADIAASVVALVITAGMIAVGAFFGLFSLAFLDHCPPATCSEEGAVNAVFTAVLLAIAIGVAGLIMTVVQLVRRAPGWPFALGTFGLCLATFVLGGFAYTAAVS
nr:hypothetical protein [Mycolicibacterium malmesburyense]